MRNGESPSSNWRHRIESASRAFVGSVVMAMCACGGKIPQDHYYTLEIPAPAPTTDPRTSFTLGIERFRAAPALQDERILYYTSPSELNYYASHQWAADPATMTAELVARRLEGMNVFSQVRLYPASAAGDFLLKGRLLNFEEVDYESGGQARVALALTLVRTRDQKVVWSETREAGHPIEQKGFEGVVGAVNAAAGQLLSAMLPHLAARVETEFNEGLPKSK